MARIYCAGPLFNEPERQEMARIARVLEAAGHKTFLPQRDGFELADIQHKMEETGMAASRAVHVVHRAIFDLDIYHLLQWSDACVANFNGRVPDEGTVVEAALTWGAGRPLVIYKADERSAFEGQDNPMLTCLTDMKVSTAIEDLPAAIDGQLSGANDRQPLGETLARGERVATTITARNSHPQTAPQELARALMGIYAD